MSCVVVVDCNDISPSHKLILMESFQAPCPQQRLPLLLEIFTFGESRGSIYLIQGGKKLLVGLLLHWADIKAVGGCLGQLVWVN